MSDGGNSNIQVEITNAHDFHCFRLILNPEFAVCKRCAGSGSINALLVEGKVPCDACRGQGRISAPDSGIEIMLHGRSLVDLIHKCSLALCDWQSQTTRFLLDRMVDGGE